MYTYPTHDGSSCKSADHRDIEIKKFSVNIGSHIPVYLQLAIQLQQVIEQHHHDPCKPLPSVYKFKCTLGISKTTVFRAYKHLNRNGVVQWIKGQGFFVDKKFKKGLSVS